MRKLLFAGLALGVLTPVVQAQTPPQFLSWEHALTTRSSKAKQPIAKLKIYNNWTSGKHRLLVKYNVSGLGGANDLFASTYGEAFAMPSFDPSRIASQFLYHNGTLGIVQNLDDNKLIAYSSEAGEHGGYFSEDRKALMKRLRFDPWKKLAPELSREMPPQLTPEQRTRLGREVRSAMRPMMKDVVKTYFRALPNRRTFTVGGEKIEARGYRMTALLNAGGYLGEEQWVRMAFEWWLAPEMPGDLVARQFLGSMLRDYRELGGPTTSMWMNETLPLMWASLPQELHLAANTLLPVALDQISESTPLLAMGGTPVYAASTIIQTTPKYGKCPNCGVEHVALPGQFETESIRVEVQLRERHTRTLRPVVFDAPPEYDEESLEPILAEWEESVEMMQGMFDGETLLSAAPEHAAPRSVYTWRALKDYTEKANALLLRAN